MRVIVLETRIIMIGRIDAGRQGNLIESMSMSGAPSAFCRVETVFEPYGVC